MIYLNFNIMKTKVVRVMDESLETQFELSNQTIPLKITAELAKYLQHEDNVSIRLVKKI